MDLGTLALEALTSSAFMGGGWGFLRFMTGWRSRRSANRKLDAETSKTGVEGAAALSKSALEWTQEANTRSKEADARAAATEDRAAQRAALSEERAVKAAERAEHAETRLAEANVRITDLLARLDEVGDQVQRLTDLVSGCVGGKVCPVQVSLQRPPNR